MARYCIYPGCDRQLKTGRKYCYVHRSFGKGQKSHEFDIDPKLGLILLGLMMLVVMYVGLLEFIEYAKLNQGKAIVSIIGLILLGLFAFWIFKKAKEIDENVKKKNLKKRLDKIKW